MHPPAAALPRVACGLANATADRRPWPRCGKAVEAESSQTTGVGQRTPPWLAAHGDWRCEGAASLRAVQAGPTQHGEHGAQAAAWPQGQGLMAPRCPGCSPLGTFAGPSHQHCCSLAPLISVFYLLGAV